MLQNASVFKISGGACPRIPSRAYEAGCDVYKFLKKSAPPPVCLLLDPLLVTAMLYAYYMFDCKFFFYFIVVSFSYSKILIISSEPCVIDICLNEGLLITFLLFMLWLYTF